MADSKRTSARQLNLNDDAPEPPVFEGSFVERIVARCRYEIHHADWRHLLISNGFLFTLLCLMTASMVMVKKTSSRLKNYPFTLGQAQPIITSFLFGFIYLCTLAFYAIKNRYFPTKDSSPSTSASEEEKSRLIDYTEGEDLIKAHEQEEERTWKWWAKLYFHLAVVGTFLSIGNILLFSGSRGDYVPGPISILLQQMTIPSTLLISIFFFRTRFFLWHYLGAVVVITGVIVTLIPEFNELHGGAKVWAVLSIIGAAVCNAMGMAYMEYYVVQTKDISLSWMWMVINVFEIFTTVPLMLAVAPLTDLSFDETFPNIGNGYACLFAGINSKSDDNCEGAIYLYIPLILIFVTSRLNIAYVVQKMNAALMWFVATCALPLANIAFTLHFIMGDAAISLNVFMIIGLLIVMAGLLMFRVSRKPEREGYAHLPGLLFNLIFRCRCPEDHCHESEPCCDRDNSA